MTQPPDAGSGPPEQPPVEPEVPGRVHLPTVTAFPYVPRDVAPAAPEPVAPVPMPVVLPPLTIFPPVRGEVPAPVPAPPAPIPMPPPPIAGPPPMPAMPYPSGPAYVQTPPTASLMMLPPPSPDAVQFYMGKPPGPKKSKAIPIFIGVIIFAVVLLISGIASMIVTAAHVRASKAPISNGSVSEAGQTVVTSRGITVTLPPRYENIPTTAEKLQKYLDKAAKLHPSIAKLVRPDFAQHLAVLAAHYDSYGDVTSTFQIATTRDYNDVQGLLREVPKFVSDVGGKDAHWGTNHLAGREVGEVWFWRPPDDVAAISTYQHMYFVPTSNGAIVIDVTARSEMTAETDIHDICQTLQVP
jgi:hypothetical protein